MEEDEGWDTERFRLKHRGKRFRHTLEGFDETCLRQTGRTTKIIDKAIDLLFQGGDVLIVDHHKRGGSTITNRLLMDWIMRRLHFEHNIGRRPTGYGKQRLAVVDGDFMRLEDVNFPKNKMTYHEYSTSWNWEWFWQMLKHKCVTYYWSFENKMWCRRIKDVEGVVYRGTFFPINHPVVSTTQKYDGDGEEG